MGKRSVIPAMAHAAAVAAERCGEPFAFIDALAVFVWARPRATTDVDVLIPRRRADLDPLIAQLDRAGFEYSGAASERHFSLWDVTTLTYTTRRRPYPLDVHTGDHPYLAGAQERSRLVEVKDIGKLRVIGVEDLLIMKLLAGRPRDLVDGAHVWLQDWTLDRPYFDRWKREFRLEGRFRQMLTFARQEKE